MKILVVDDFVLNTLRWKHLLERSGHTVVVAPNGEKAKQAISQDSTIRLVIADLLMPEFNGVELFKHVLRLTRHDDTGQAQQRPRFILVTAVRPETADTGERRLLTEAQALGIDALLHKPGTPEELLEQVKLADEAHESADAGQARQLLKQVRELLNELSSKEDKSELKTFRGELQSLLT